MALINIDLGSSDQTINEDNANAGDTINLSVVGSHTLTVDGVDVTLNGLAGISVGSTPTFATVNDANLVVDYGLLNVSALGGITYEVGDSSSITVNESTVALGVGVPQTINFTGAGAGSFTYNESALGSAAAFEVNGFSWGDSLSFNNADLVQSASMNGNDMTLVLRDEGGLLGAGANNITFTLNDIDPDLATQIMANPSSFFADGTFVAPVCFLAGTLISTDKGQVVVEDIEIGDKVECLGGLREVRWVGYRHDLIRRVPEEKRDDFFPVVIKQGAISDNVPSRDLSVSPWHHIYTDGMLFRAKDLVNGSSIFANKDMAAVSYYHIELDQFDVILAHGLYSEAYVDGGNRDFFQNADVVSLRPEQLVRRRAERPGFEVAKDSKLIHAMQKRFSDRALLSGEARADEPLPTKLSA